MRLSRLLPRVVRCGLSALLLAGLTGCPRAERPVNLYCSQDEEFAKALLAAFHDETGLTVAPKYDTEANKSVSHYSEILSEKGRPRCDVFWNNEPLSTIRLQRQGLLLPYDSPSAKPYPAWDKAEDHTWHAFANRARVVIVNTELVAEKDRPRSLLDLTDQKWRGRAVMAKPNHGTSATQAACLFEALGGEKASAFYRGLKANQIHVAPGNKDVAVWVGKGKTANGDPAVVGVTDTDDAMEEIKDGHPVAIIFPDHDAPKDGRLGTLFIPNTLAIIKGSPNPEGAKRLVDYLLSAQVEGKLAESESHQIPINPDVRAKLPPELEPLRTAKPMRVDYYKAADRWDEVQTFLNKEFAP